MRTAPSCSGPPGVKIETRSSAVTIASTGFAASSYERSVCWPSITISAPIRFEESTSQA